MSAPSISCRRSCRSFFQVLALVLFIVLSSHPGPAKALMPFPRSIWDSLLLDDPFRVTNYLLDQPDPAFSLSLPLPFPVSNPSKTAVAGDDASWPTLLARSDWKETPTSHVISVDIPGIKKEDVKIEVDEESRLLKISGERKADKEDEEHSAGGKWHRLERTCGKFWRHFRMPRDAQVDKVQASLVDGVLRITVPKMEVKPHDQNKSRPKLIDISTSSTSTPIITPSTPPSKDEM